jgi:hypothetical protein
MHRSTAYTLLASFGLGSALLVAVNKSPHATQEDLTEEKARVRQQLVVIAGYNADLMSPADRVAYLADWNQKLCQYQDRGACHPIDKSTDIVSARRLMGYNVSHLNREGYATLQAFDQANQTRFRYEP